MAPPTTQTGNRLLASLAKSDFALLQPHLEPVELAVRFELEWPDTFIETIYFPDHGIASVVATTRRDTLTEVGLIGSEGMSGLVVILAGDRSPHQTFMQVAGSGHRLPAEWFRNAFARSATLRMHFLRYANAFAIQIACTAAANARATVEQRLARWILMSRDRLRDDDIPLTHEFLATMLGVRRAGVTDGLGALAARKFIHQEGRGALAITNRKGLETIAGEFYGVPEREYARLMDSQ